MADEGNVEEPIRKRRRLSDQPNTDENSSGSHKMKTVLCLCGSMNPITLMHTRMFEIARDWLHKSGKYAVQGGLISPVHIAYGKKGLLSNEHRLNMSHLAVKSSDWIKVSDWECSQSGWTTTNSTLIQLQAIVKKQYGADVHLQLLCGADLLESFATPNLWADQDVRDIVQNYGIVVISRSGTNAAQFVYETDVLHALKNNIEIVTNWIPNDVSSTKIRRALSRGESVKYLVSDEVLEYIQQHNLYQ